MICRPIVDKSCNLYSQLSVAPSKLYEQGKLGNNYFQRLNFKTLCLISQNDTAAAGGLFSRIELGKKKNGGY